MLDGSFQIFYATYIITEKKKTYHVRSHLLIVHWIDGCYFIKFNLFLVLSIIVDDLDKIKKKLYIDLKKKIPISCYFKQKKIFFNNCTNEYVNEFIDGTNYTLIVLFLSFQKKFTKACF